MPTKKPILLKLNPAVVERLDSVRWKLKITRTKVIRLAISEYLNRIQQESLHD